MTDRSLEYLEFELPEGWVQVDAPGGPLFQAASPDTDGYRSGVVADLYAGFGGLAEAHREFHAEQVESLARVMTDALLVDDAEVTVAGLPALTSTIAYRQGLWNVTARVWTIDALDSAVMVFAFCDSDVLTVDGPAFESMIQSIVITPTGEGSHA